jgi:acyl transferase domain-containing protein
MAAVEATEQEVLPLLGGGAGIAAVNGPASVVVSGDEASVGRLAGHFTGLGRRVSRLRVSHAFHSALMEPMLEEFATVAASLSYAAPSIPVLSTVTGQAETDLGAAYWVRQARAAVRFADAVSAARDLGVGHFLELGPGAVLTPHIHAVADTAGAGAVVVPALRARHDEPTAVLYALAALYTTGIGVDWRAVHPAPAHQHVDLPTYPFQRQRYWAQALDSKGRAAALASARPPDPALDAVQDLRWQLAGLPDDERDHVLLEQVRTHVAAVLGHSSESAVEPDRAFTELGFDSVAAVELRKRLSLATGLALPATLVYDHPSSRAVAAHIADTLVSGEHDAGQPVLAELERLEAALARYSPADGERDPVRIRLEALLRRWRDSHEEEMSSMDEATDDQLFDVLNREIGIV